jgi:hypothetical protein
MSRKADIELNYIVIIIIALATLAIILGYIFFAEGGPKSLIDSIIGFLSGSVEYAESTGNI